MSSNDEPLNVIAIIDNLNFYYPQLFIQNEIYNELVPILMLNIYNIWSHSKRIKYKCYSQFENEIYNNNLFILNNPIDKFIVSGQIQTIKIVYDRITLIPHVTLKIDDNSINERNQLEKNFITFHINNNFFQLANVDLEKLIRGQHIKLLCNNVNFQKGIVEVLQIINYNFSLQNQISHWNNCSNFWKLYSDQEWNFNDHISLQSSPLLLSPISQPNLTQTKDTSVDHNSNVSLDNKNAIEVIDISDPNEIPPLNLNSKSNLPNESIIEERPGDESLEMTNTKIVGITDKSFQNLLLEKCIELPVPIYTNDLYQSLLIPLQQLSNLQLQNQSLPHLKHFTLENLMSQNFFNHLNKLKDFKIIKVIGNGNEINNKILKDLYKYCQDKSNYWFKLQLTLVKLNLTQISIDWVNNHGWERMNLRSLDDIEVDTAISSKLVILLFKIVLTNATKILKEWFFDLSLLNQKNNKQKFTSNTNIDNELIRNKDTDDVVYLHLSYK